MAVNDGTWHHVVATRDSATGATQVYVDGALNASGTGPAGKLDSPQIRIGDVVGGGGTFFNGTIDQLQIFDYVLNATDVAALCDRTKGSLP
jgi:hypothetical protein